MTAMSGFRRSESGRLAQTRFAASAIWNPHLAVPMSLRFSAVCPANRSHRALCLSRIPAISLAAKRTRLTQEDGAYLFLLQETFEYKRKGMTFRLYTLFSDVTSLSK